MISSLISKQITSPCLRPLEFSLFILLSLSLLFTHSDAYQLPHTHSHIHTPITGCYTHIPFCRRRCFYCDFAVQPIGESLSLRQRVSRDYAVLLKREIALAESVIRENSRNDESLRDIVNLDTIYFGGGTPSLMRDEGESLIKTHCVDFTHLNIVNFVPYLFIFII